MSFDSSANQKGDDYFFRWRAEPEIEDLTYGLNGHLQAEQHKDLPRNAQVRIAQIRTNFTTGTLLSA